MVNFQTTLSSLESKFEEVHNALTSIADSCRNGLLIGDRELKAAAEMLTELRVLETNCLEQLSSFSLEKPRSLSDMHALMDVYRTTQMVQAKVIFLEFLKLEALSPDFAEPVTALKQRILECLEKDDFDEEVVRFANDLIDLHSLLGNTIDSSKQLLCSRIQEVFGMPILMALLSSKLRLPSESATISEQPTEGNIESSPPQEQPHNPPAEVVGVQECQEPSPVLCEKEVEAPPKKTQADTASEQKEGNAPHYARHPEIIRVSGAYPSRSGKSIEKFSTKSFESQIKKHSAPIMCNILISLRFFLIAATIEQLEKYFALILREKYTTPLEGETTIIGECVDALYRYGYLTEINIPGVAPVYCLSADGRTAFTRDSSKKLLHSFSAWRQAIWALGIMRTIPNDIEHSAFYVDTLLRNVNALLKINSFNKDNSEPTLWYQLAGEDCFYDSATFMCKNFSADFIRGYVCEDIYNEDIFMLLNILKKNSQSSELPSADGVPAFRFIIVETLDEASAWQQLLRENSVSAYILVLTNSLSCFDENGPIDIENLLSNKPLPDIPIALQATELNCVNKPLVTTAFPLEAANEPTKNSSSSTEMITASDATSAPLPTETAVPAPVKNVSEELDAMLKLAANRCIPEAVLYLKATILKAPEALPLYEKFAYALDDPLMKVPYSCAEYDRIFSEYAGTPIDDFLRECLEICSQINTFYAPINPQDGQLQALWKRIRSDKSNHIFAEVPKLRELIGTLSDFVSAQRIGLQFCTTDDSRAQIALKREKDKVIDDVENKLRSYPDLIANFKSARHAKVGALTDDLFSKNGVISSYLQAILDPLAFSSVKVFCERFHGIPIPVEGTKDISVVVNDQIVGDYLDERWDALDVHTKGKANQPLLGKQRIHFVNRVKEAVELMARYSLIVERLQAYGDERQHRAAESCAAAVRELLSNVLSSLDTLQTGNVSAEAGLQILKYRLMHIYDSLCNKQAGSRQIYFYIDFLKSGQVELNEEYLPCEFSSTDPFLINHTLSLLEGYSLQDRILKHCELPKRNWESSIRINFVGDPSLGIEAGDDYGTLSLIRKYLLEIGQLSDDVWPSKYDIEINRKQAEKRLAREEENFIEQIEMAENYGQINDQEKMNSLLAVARSGRLYAEKSYNYGFYFRMSSECLNRLKKNSESNISKLSGKLSKLRELRDADDDPDSWTIVESVDNMLRGYNYTVAEDYLNLALQHGHKSVPSIVAADEDPLAQFISQYNAIYRSCTESGNTALDLSKIYNKFHQNVHVSKRSNKNAASAIELVGKWPSGGSNSYRRETLEAFMKQLSFEVANIIKEPVSLKANISVFTVNLAPAQYSKEEWKHPIAAFGSLAAESGLRIICLWGSYTPSNLYDILNNLGSNIKCAGTIVLVDYALARKDRDDLARIIKQARPQHPCIFVDRVMALFLTEYPQLERANVLLQIALPFSYLQPYVPDSVSMMPPEMFIGRKNELKSVLDPAGATLVYGGRQLGKSALLRRAKSMRHDPAQGFYAIFVDIKNRSYEESLANIIFELAEAGLKIGACSDWDDFGRKLRELIRAQRLNYLLLLIDEADTLLNTSASIDYRPLEVMKTVQTQTDGKFKFVLAGLRDVVRFDKSKALRNNSILVHFSHITIKPLSYLEAQSLLQIPLNYLGVRVQPQDIELLSLIFARTNYYPSLIHLYCQNLIEALPVKQTDLGSTPPYMLSGDLIKKLLKAEHFRKSMRQKLEITLELGDDNFYYKLAVLLAYHYYVGKSGATATARDLMNISADSGNVLKDLSPEQVEALLDEMVELNVLQVTAERQGARRFAFNRYNFTQMLDLGSEDTVFDRLCQYV
ncbi:MAG: ATP-binding protein [Clostridiaceae bacterium]